MTVIRPTLPTSAGTSGVTSKRTCRGSCRGGGSSDRVGVGVGVDCAVAVGETTDADGAIVGGADVASELGLGDVSLTQPTSMVEISAAAASRLALVGGIGRIRRQL
ncbi:MAG TPA: hypothetical protein VFM74_00315 [Candidatus Limnocylindria bacterium]|nr:hypothetical protein [Candidatus Limnocylindria bacterium]